jgi:hypothetical protein
MELSPQYVSDLARLSSLIHATNGVDDGSRPETPNPPAKLPHIILDGSGDVILKLGDPFLLVSLKVLSVASPVFAPCLVLISIKAMLSPKGGS